MNRELIVNLVAIVVKVKDVARNLSASGLPKLSGITDAFVAFIGDALSQC